MKIEGLNKIYIMHYEPLKERRAYLEKRLKDLGLADYMEWVVFKKDAVLTEKEKALCDRSEKTLTERRKFYNELPKFGEIDIFMVTQHRKVLQKIALQKDKKISIIFEDDVLLSDNFPLKLQETIKKLNSVEWDVCYSDSGSLFVAPTVVLKHGETVGLYKHPKRGSNTTGSYLVNSMSAKKILNAMKKFSLSIDMELTYIQNKNNFNVYWAIPFLTHQGSIECVYQSNVRKGTLSGLMIKYMRKIEKINPSLAQLVGNSFDVLRNKTYNSKSLLYIKDKIKEIMKY